MASVGKTFTAATIFRLIELGQLSLDTTLDQVVSEPAANLLRDDGYAIESITIEQLLLLHLNDLGIGVWLESGAAPPNGAIPIARSFFGTTELTGLDFSIDGFGGGGLAGTTTDIAVFYDALLHGRLFDRSSTLDAMLAVPPTNLGIEEFGVLLGDGARGLYRLDLAGVECWAHRGFLGTIAVSCPTTDVTVVVTTNVALTDPLPIARELVALALQ